MDTLVSLMGAVALLLWGIRMVSTGLQRAFPRQLPRLLRKAAEYPPLAAFCGAVSAACLQSSTAVVTLVAGFTAQGILPMAKALCIVLGADVGSALAAVLLSFDLSTLSPVLIFIGVLVFLTNSIKQRRNLGRFTLGFGLVLLALSLISETADAIKSAEAIRVIISGLGNDLGMAVLVGLILSVLTYSSLATVLLISSFAASALLSMEAGIALIIGANIGSGIPALIASWSMGRVGRSIPLSNLLMRTIAGLISSALIPLIAVSLLQYNVDKSLSLVFFHLALNGLLMLVFLPLTGLVSRCVIKLQAEKSDSPEMDPNTPIYLAERDLHKPSRALANASRETLRMAETVHHMLNESIDAFNDKNMIALIRSKDETVDALHRDITLYLASLIREKMSQQEGERTREIFSFVTNLEHIGDIIDHNLMDLARGRADVEADFSPQGWHELITLHRELIENFSLALDVFMTGDTELAEQLLAEKRAYRDRVEVSNLEHFKRLNEGRSDSIETSLLHLDMLRDFKRISSHLSSVAYPIIEE